MIVYIKNITTGAQEHLIKLLSVNTVCFKVTAVFLFML